MYRYRGATRTGELPSRKLTLAPSTIATINTSNASAARKAPASAKPSLTPDQSRTVCGTAKPVRNVTSATKPRSGTGTPVADKTPGRCPVTVSRVDQLVEKIKTLENEQKLLSAKIDQLNSTLGQLTSTECKRCTRSACSAPVTVPISPPAQVPNLTSLVFKRIVIASDSMGRDLSYHLKRNMSGSGDTHILSSVKPGALFKDVVGPISTTYPDLSRDDVVVVIGGTNDMPRLPPHGLTSAFLNFSPVAELSRKTNVIVCTVPHRHDQRAHWTTNIHFTNQGILFRADMHGATSFDVNSFLSRRHFTRHGLHLNRFGKAILAKRLLRLLVDLSPRSPVSHTDVVDVSESTFSVSPAPRGPHSPLEQSILDVSVMNDNLLDSSHFSYPIPLISNVLPQSFLHHSNFDAEGQTHIT